MGLYPPYIPPTGHFGAKVPRSETVIAPFVDPLGPFGGLLGCFGWFVASSESMFSSSCRFWWLCRRSRAHFLEPPSENHRFYSSKTNDFRKSHFLVSSLSSLQKTRFICSRVAFGLLLGGRRAPKGPQKGPRKLANFWPWAPFGSFFVPRRNLKKRKSVWEGWPF